LDEIIQDAEREDEEEQEAAAVQNLNTSYPTTPITMNPNSAASTQYNKSKGAFNL